VKLAALVPVIAAAPPRFASKSTAPGSPNTDRPPTSAFARADSTCPAAVPDSVNDPADVPAIATVPADEPDSVNCADEIPKIEGSPTEPKDTPDSVKLPADVPVTDTCPAAAPDMANAAELVPVMELTPREALNPLATGLPVSPRTETSAADRSTGGAPDSCVKSWSP